MPDMKQQTVHATPIETNLDSSIFRKAFTDTQLYYSYFGSHGRHTCAFRWNILLKVAYITIRTHTQIIYQCACGWVENRYTKWDITVLLTNTWFIKLHFKIPPTIVWGFGYINDILKASLLSYARSKCRIMKLTCVFHPTGFSWMKSFYQSWY